MKAFLAIAVLALVLGVASAAPNHKLTRKVQSPDANLCPVCVEFAGDALNELINIVLNVGVIGSCGEVCGLLTNRTHSRAEGLVCDLLCDYVGITEFIKAIEKADLDPIYYCELLNTCAINDNGDATIRSFTTSPVSGPQGTTFTFDLDWSTINGTGTGEIILVVQTVDGLQLGDSSLLEATAPGEYVKRWQVDAKPDPDCDPTQDECEEWLPGQYIVQMAICNGECGSKHPHSMVFAQAQSSFTLV
ncbi:countin2 [Capsaspora owczarzaki ATCC 30864]|nr:countin2 [Capsaspora owczarzaki ATCC 30864]|eukprot:XP_004365279.1 countin2 [Capsaspora owczarzaki ATCC 30864]